MNCPNCNNKLTQQQYKEMTVDKCANCSGIWLDFKELDQLEDTVLLNDDLKGTLAWDKKHSDKKCPKCKEKMTQFNYRLNDLILEYCEKNLHGFWLDKGEEERVIAEMEESSEKLENKFIAEREWARHLKRLQSPSFFSKIKDLLQ